MNTKSEGGTSLNEGEIELMIHRKSSNDDNKGMNERLEDRDQNGIPFELTTTHIMIFGQKSNYCHFLILNFQNSLRNKEEYKRVLIKNLYFLSESLVTKKIQYRI